MSTETRPLSVQAVLANATFYQLNVYDGETLVGEYERATEADIARRSKEVELASEVLRGVFAAHGAFQVRWNQFSRSKVIRVEGKTVGAIPSECIQN